MTRGAVAVTGASGFLGQWAVAALTREGYDVVALSRRPIAEPVIGTLAWTRHVRTIPCDLSMRDSVAAVKAELARVEALVHLAACAPGDALASLAVNTRGTVHLLAALEGARLLRSVVHASTFEIYGNPRSLPIDEDHPTDPTSFHGASTLAAENYVRIFGAGRRVGCCSLRFPVIYGPGDRSRRAIGGFIRAAALGEDLVIHGDGEDRLDLVYAADAAAAIAAAVGSRASGPINIGGGSGRSLGEIAECVVRVSGASSRIARRDRVEPRIDLALSIDRARACLGWSPATPLEEGIRAHLEWVRSTL